MDNFTLRTFSSNNNDEDGNMLAKRRRLVLQGIGVTVASLGIWYHEKYIEKQPTDNLDMLREQMLRRLYNESDDNCYDQLRVNKKSFAKLCDILRKKGGLRDCGRVYVEEAVAIFLHVLAHNTKFQVIKGFYIRSGETISRQFGRVLKAVLKLTDDYISIKEANLEAVEDEKWRCFKNCLGALDGTYIPLTVPHQDQGRYRNRKQQIATNVLGVCDKNMKIVYVLPGWEGSASDSRVLRNALTRPRPFIVPRGKYYLVDAGYANGPGFLAPYRSTRYHLNEWAASGNNPTTYKELFNLRHSTTRNVIERTFGLLKKRWAILRTASFFDVKTQVRIINACCILHNFIREEQIKQETRLLVDVDAELAAVQIPDDTGNEEVIRSVQLTPEWTAFRENLAKGMFAEYQARHRRGV